MAGVVDDAAVQTAVTEARKRRIVHGSGSRKRREVEAKPIALKELKDASTDLSDAAQLTMREIIKRAEAIERRKQREEKEEAAKKAANGGEGKGSTSNAAARSNSVKDTPSTSALTPQVQVVNGRIVINQQSLVVGAQESTREDTESYRRVEETRSKLNYNSYSNRTPVERWRKDDTELFYKALQQFGTDFELIQNLFPGRTRRQVKAKFKNEEKNNSIRLADVLGHKIQDQSHHYRAIIEILKPEKGNEEESYLDSLLRSRSPVDATKDASNQKTDEIPNEQNFSAEKVATSLGEDNIVVAEKVKEDTTTNAEETETETGTPSVLTGSKDSEPVADPPAINLQSEEVTPVPVEEISSAPKPRGNPFSKYRRKPKVLESPLVGNATEETLMGV